jgi:hypothetical protein
MHRRGSNWKQDWYRLGDRVTVDASPFFPKAPAERAAQLSA